MSTSTTTPRLNFKPYLADLEYFNYLAKHLSAKERRDTRITKRETFRYSLQLARLGEASEQNGTHPPPPKNHSRKRE